MPRSAICWVRSAHPMALLTKSSRSRRSVRPCSTTTSQRKSAVSCASSGCRRGRRNTSSKRNRALRAKGGEHMDVPQKLESPAGFLASVEILSPFTAEEIEQLAERAEPRFYAFGETICNAGDAADGLFVVKAGSVRIFTEENGKEISMGVRREREVFADIAMLREYRHESSVRSSGKTELLFIPRRVIEPIVANNPAALAFVTSYVAISSAGGFVAKLFDLRGKIDKAELEASVRS